MADIQNALNNNLFIIFFVLFVNEKGVQPSETCICPKATGKRSSIPISDKWFTLGVNLQSSCSCVEYFTGILEQEGKS